MKAHRKALKGFVEEIFPNHETPLYYHKRTVVDDDALPDEQLVEKIINHRQDKEGKYHFLTKWQGWEETTWEPAKTFFMRYSSDLVKYCKEKNIHLNVNQELAPGPTQG